MCSLSEDTIRSIGAMVMIIVMFVGIPFGWVATYNFNEWCKKKIGYR
jgi:ABC-type dipeptide/oligopeptide/nickel transport system permease component